MLARYFMSCSLSLAAMATFALSQSPSPNGVVTLNPRGAISTGTDTWSVGAPRRRRSAPPLRPSPRASQWRVPPTPHLHGGSRRHKSIYHALSRLKCLSALASIKIGEQHAASLERCQYRPKCSAARTALFDHLGGSGES
jgi:hypothetical protein